MTRDLLLSHPTPENLHIVPTARDPSSSLALSSRNAYLTEQERAVAAPTLYAALSEGRTSWAAGLTKAECVARARALVQNKADGLVADGIEMKLDYIEMNDPDSFEVMQDASTRTTWETEITGRPVILSGAMWVGKTRLIDNVIIGSAPLIGVLAN